MFQLTHKQLLELKFWIEEEAADRYISELCKMPLYCSQFGRRFVTSAHNSVLEIGTGPAWGLLPHMNADIKYGCDPLYPVYEAAGLLRGRNGILRVDEPFEAWETNLTFDAIVTVNALDHGEMGFYLLPKIWRMLKPGGRFYCHVHLRPDDMLNLVHDHSLTESQLDLHLRYTNLVQEHREILPNDIDGKFCPALVGIWRKP